MALHMFEVTVETEADIAIRKLVVRVGVEDPTQITPCVGRHLEKLFPDEAYVYEVTEKHYLYTEKEDEPNVIRLPSNIKYLMSRVHIGLNNGKITSTELLRFAGTMTDNGQLDDWLAERGC